jgi:succinate dehydrogenase / fumarate reductase membrane anchor subunit
VSQPVNALSKFLGRDPGHKGANHWRAQRLGALALIPLSVWFLAGMLCLPDYSFETLQPWVATPWRSLLLALLVACIAWHSKLGVQVVIEDYVPGKGAQAVSLVVSAIAHGLLGAAGVLAVLLIAFKG